MPRREFFTSGAEFDVSSHGRNLATPSDRVVRPAPKGGLFGLFGAPVFAVVPAAPMPMTTKIGSIDRHGHHMARAGGNVAVAARAHVVLVGLIRLNEAGFDFAEALGIDHPKNIQMMSAMNTTVAAPT